MLGRNLASPVSCGAQPELLCCLTKTSAAIQSDFRCRLIALGLCHIIVFINDVISYTCIWWIFLYLECCIIDLSCVRCYPGLTCEGPLLHADRGATGHGRVVTAPKLGYQFLCCYSLLALIFKIFSWVCWMTLRNFVISNLSKPCSCIFQWARPPVDQLRPS